METTEDLSLREKKYAQTKLALLRAAIKKIQENPLSAISVKELCEAVPVSEMTFYNYFPKKTDVLVYYIQVTMLEAVWYLQHAVKNKTHLEMVEECFDFLARKLVADPLVMTETLAYFGQERKLPEFPALSQAEQTLAFPNLPDIEQLSVENTRLETVVEPYLEQAIQHGELPSTLALNTVVLMSFSIFTGLVMNLHLTEPELIRPLCRRQLRLLWKALRAEAEEEKSHENSG
jgi:AcrR family transcriptional regulator